ncbi:HU family DNA-binding protein [Prevotella jejuni]
MTVNYKLLRTSGKLAQRKALRIVPIKKDVTGIERICQHIQQATTLTTADILGTISALKTELVEELKSGNTVHLPGIGFFSIALKGDMYEDPKTHRHHLRNAAVRKIRFRTDKDFYEALGEVDFANKTYKDGTPSLPMRQAVNAALKELFEEKPIITVNDLRRRLNLSTTYAYQLAAQLEREKKIINIGSRYRKIYRKT